MWIVLDKISWYDAEVHAMYRVKCDWQTFVAHPIFFHLSLCPVSKAMKGSKKLLKKKQYSMLSYALMFFKVLWCVPVEL